MGQTMLTRFHNQLTKNYGAFHTGVEVYGKEWSYGMTFDNTSGIISHEPAKNADHTFRETLSMGYTRFSPREVGKILEDLKRDWRGRDYHVLTKNCHHFSEVFCARLGVARLPPWINTLAATGADTLEPSLRPKELVWSRWQLKNNAKMSSEKSCQSACSGKHWDKLCSNDCGSFEMMLRLKGGIEMNCFPQLLRRWMRHAKAALRKRSWHPTHWTQALKVKQFPAWNLQPQNAYLQRCLRRPRCLCQCVQLLINGSGC